MRFNQRLLRILAVAACLTIIFYALSFSSAPSTIHDHVSSLKENYGWPSSSSSTSPTSPSSPSSPSTKDGGSSSSGLPTSTHDLWQFWSKAFEDARPTVDHIHLRSHAGMDPIASDDFSLREPPYDRVINRVEDIEALRVSHARFLQTLKARKESGEDIYKGRGIVMVGGGEYFGPAIIGLHMLRRTGSDLPVEVFVADESEYESQICDDYLPKLGAKCYIITEFLHSASGEEFEVTHYQLKSLAMLFSSFADVLYLDSDSIPLVDPELELFTKEPYLSSGLVIWPDFWIASESPQYYHIAGLSDFPQGLPKSSSEAGQLLINKKTHLKTLLLANYYNVYGPKLYYSLLSQGALGEGDKETFLAAATVLGEKWYRVETKVEAVGRWAHRQQKGTGMVQHHPLDDMRFSQARAKAQAGNETVEEVAVRPAFLHANTPKMNAGHLVDEGDLEDDGKRLRLLGSLEDQIREFGDDVERTIWELLVQTGCELQHVVQDWKERENMCERLREHWDDVFGGGLSGR